MPKTYSTRPIDACVALTTGQVARLCQVAPRTVSKWFDSGMIKGYKIPGSEDRRIPRGNLLRFMIDHGIPLPIEIRPEIVASFGLRSDEPVGIDCQTAHNAFAFGILLATEQIGTVLLGDAFGLTDLVAAAALAAEHHPAARIVVVIEDDIPDAAIPGPVHRIEYRPVDWQKVVARP